MMTAGVNTGPAPPNEIQDYILDLLQDSKPTLKACALVCRAWVPRSRYHLFSNITLQGRSARVFEVLLKNPNCTIQSCVHLAAYLRDTSETMNVANILQCLSPSSFDIRYWSNGNRQAFATFPPFPSIKRLEVGTGCFGDLAELFVTFPNLRELYMNYSSPGPPQVNHCCSDIFIRPSQLRSLEFTSCEMDPLLRWFIEKRIVPTNLLSIDDLAGDEAFIVGEYFSMFGDVLQEVRMGFVSDEAEVLCKYEQLYPVFCINTRSLSISKIL